MLSYLYKVSCNFERQHGYAPNLLYLSNQHFEQLKAELADIPQLADLTLFLGMELVISSDCLHPEVVWSAVEWQRAIAV